MSVDKVISARNTDVEIKCKGSILGIYSDPGKNSTLGSKVVIDAPFGIPLENKMVEFKDGYNNHFLKATWGRIDQLCLRQMKALRLITLMDMLKPNRHVVDGQHGVRLTLDRLNREQRKIYNDIFGVQCEFINQVFRVKKGNFSQRNLLPICNCFKTR